MRLVALCWLSITLVASTAASAADGTVAAPPPSACEIHFWPASDIDTYPTATQAQGGPVWAALGGKKHAIGFQAIRSEMASRLDGEGAILALGKADLAARLGLPPAQLIIHEAPLDRHGLYRIRDRRAASRSPCYSELIVTSLLYRKGGFGGQSLDSSFMLREFGAGNAPLRVTRGGGSTRLSAFPAKEGEDSQAASAELAAAFRLGFEKFTAGLRSGPKRN